MSIWGTLTVRTLKDRKARTVVTVLGIFLSAMLMSGVVTFAASLQNFLVKSDSEIYGNWHVAVYGTNEEQIAVAKKDKNVSAISTSSTIGYAKIGGVNNEFKPYLYVATANKNLFKQMKIEIAQGRMAEASDEIVLPRHLAIDGGIVKPIGSKVKLKIGTRVDSKGNSLFQNQGLEKEEALSGEVTKTYTVTGIMERPNTEPYQAPGYTAFVGDGNSSASNSRTGLGVGDGNSTASNSSVENMTSGETAFITLNNPKEVYSFTDKYFGKNSNIVYNEEQLVLLGASQDNYYRNIMLTICGILIGLIILGTVTLIYNAFSISVKDRIRQLGMLASVGATKKQIREVTIREGIGIGLMGIPAGLLAGVGLIGATIHFLTGTFNSLIGEDIKLQFTLKVSPLGLVITGAIAFITVLAAVYLPALRAGKLTPIAAIRPRHVLQEKTKSIKKKNGKKISKYFSLSRTLAFKYFKRDEGRYKATIISLFLSIVLFVSATGFTGYLKQTAQKDQNINNDYDISYTTSGNDTAEEDKEDYIKLKSSEAVYDSSFIEEASSGSVKISTKTLGRKTKKILKSNELVKKNIATIPMTILIIEEKSFAKYASVTGIKESSIIATKKIRVYGETGKATKNIDLSKRVKGKTISFGESGNIKIDKYVKVLPWECSDNQGSATVIMSDKTADKVLGDYSPYVQFRCFAFKSSAPNLTYKSMKKICQKENMDTENIYNRAGDRKAYSNLILLVKIFSYGFIILISLIAVANVVNTISTNILTRKREIAMLKSIGMRSADFYNMMKYECLLYGAKGLAYGIPVSILMSWLIYKFLIGEEVSYAFPWQGIMISVISVFLIVFVTMLYAMRKVNKENTVEILRRE